MSLDIQYRPHHYEDVVGQQGTVRILREICRTNKGFQQSYLFAGSHGSGKTTTARIFAKSLLCESPVEGQACDGCDSCIRFKAGTLPNYIEVDAATHSGKADMKKIVDSLSFATFSGNRTIYVMDEAHQLSRDALDALLKPMEDPIRGSEDKQLVCIFCTTEPEKMRATILSRCAPAFVIRKPAVQDIVDRLKYVADQEEITTEDPALVALVEATRSHMRDALKALGSLSTIGGATWDNVVSYLGLGNQDLYFDVIDSIGVDLPKVIDSADEIMSTTSPTSFYNTLLEIIMVAHRVHCQLTGIPSYMPTDRVHTSAQSQSTFLVNIAQKVADRVSKPSKNMVLCDLAVLHHMKAGTLPSYVPTTQQSTPSQVRPNTSPSNNSSPGIHETADASVNIGEKDGVFAPMRATKGFLPDVASQPDLIENGHLSRDAFFLLLRQRTDEIKNSKSSLPKAVDRP